VGIGEIKSKKEFPICGINFPGGGKKLLGFFGFFQSKKFKILLAGSGGFFSHM